MTENTGMDLLNDAFNTFRDASRKLEQQYALLEQRIDYLNEELAEKNRAMERSRRLAAMGEMAAKIAHEIRNPLGSMAIFASLLERELGTDFEKRRLAEHITKGVKTLDNILSNMLLFAASPSARLKQIDIQEIIEDSLLLTRGREKGGVEIKTEFKGSTSMMGDQHLLRQLFINLFINALDALEDGGELTVKTRSMSNGFIEIEVSDTGSGIPEDSIDRIFDPFFSSKDRGTGLGLAIVSTVVDAHNGSINLWSKVNEGTSFRIMLPVSNFEKIAC